MKKSKSAKDSRPSDAASRAAPLPSAGLAILAGLYLIWFIQASPPRPGQQSPVRLALLNELRDPFGFIAQWFGPAGTPLGFLDRVPVVLMAALILIAAIGLGRLIIDGLRLAPGITELERMALAAAVGLSGLSTMVLLVGLAGGLGHRWLLWLLVGGLAGLAGWRFYRDQRSRRRMPSAIRTPLPATAWLAIPLATALLLGACLPPWDFDVREYHLQVPKEWLQQRRITLLPHNVYGNMPLGAEMHALLAMGLWPGQQGWFYGALAGKVIMASFAVITALGVASAGERLAGRAGGALAALVFISHPWVIHVSVHGLNDGALAAYVFLAFYAMWLARCGACSFLLPGLLAGAAAACKYPGLVFAVMPLAVWAIAPVGRVSNPSAEDGLEIRPTEGDGLQIHPTRALALLLAGALLGGGGWYAKNAALAGNPVYPLAYRVFGGTTRTPEKDSQWNRAHQVPRDEQGRRYSARQLAASAARIAGRDDLASPLILPLLAAAGIALFVARRSRIPQSAIRNPHLALLAALALVWILAVWWLLSHRLDRFLLPAWPFAAVLAAGAAWLDNRWWQRGVQLLVFVGLAYCYLAASSRLVGDNRWFVSLEQLRHDAPWPEGTPLRVKRGHQFLNAHIQPGQSVLLVGDAAPFDLEMRAYYNTCFDDCLLCDWMLGKSADERRQELTQRDIAWVLVDWPEIARYHLPGNYGFDPRFSPQLLDELIAQGILGRPQSIDPPAPDRPRPVEIYRIIPATNRQPGS